MASINSINRRVDGADLTISDGRFNLPATTSTVGSIKVNGSTFAFYRSGVSFGFGNWGPGVGGSGSTVMGNNCGTNGRGFDNGANIGDGVGYHHTGYCQYSIGIGNQALHEVVDCGGNNIPNIAIGYHAGTNYGFVRLLAIGYEAGTAGVGDNSIVIGHVGVSSEGNVFRLGTTGSGDKQQNICYIAGIYNYDGTLGATNAGVIVDSAEQMQKAVNNASSTTGTTYSFRKIRGAGAITDGDDIGVVDFNGYNGSAYAVGARILGKSKTGSTVANMAGQLIFYTKPDSATALTTRMTIDSTGAITIAAPDSGVGLTISNGGSTVTGTIQGDTLRTSTAATYLSLTNATVSALGSDSNIAITLTPKGAGRVSTSKKVYSAGISFNGGTTTMANYATNTWTPDLQFGGAKVGITYGTQTGTYWRIGQLIYYTCRIILTSKGSSNGSATIAGLPATVSSNSRGNAVLGVATFSGSVTGCNATASSTSLGLYFVDTAGGAITAFADTHLADTSVINCSGFYFV